MVKTGLGIGWGLKKCVENYLKNKELYELDTKFDLPLSYFSIAFNEEVLNNTTKEFLKLFKQKMKYLSK